MLYIGLLFIIEILLFVTNYKHGTYLMGWDNLMPEFNIGLNLQRSLVGVWQEYRGLGLLDGLAHTANLMHTLYIAFLRLFLPQSSVRYAFIFLIHLTGGIGIFYLIKYLFTTKVAIGGTDDRAPRLAQRSEHWWEGNPGQNLSQIKIVAFLGSLFYMFNLGVIQMFFAPLEVFVFHFAALPLITLLILKSLENPNKKNLIVLFIASFLLSPQGFVPTLFLVFLALVFFLVFFDFIRTRQWKKSLLIFSLIIASNIFWLLPYVYGLKYTAQVIPNTKINQISSEEIFFRNKAYGDPMNVLGLKGFMMEAVEYDNVNKVNAHFLKEWNDHENTILYKITYFGLLAVALFGLYGILRNKKRKFYPFILSFALGFFFLANNTPVLEQMNSLLRAFLPAIAEAYRFPFTKFILLFAFSLSIFFAYGLSNLQNMLSKFKNYMFLILFLFLFCISLPAFQGQFMSPLLKVKLPNEYLKLFDYMGRQDENRRVALLPAHTFWNWQYRTFGQRGSGFLWYGIKQPLLDRPFDPWSFENEQFYNEVSYAINSEDVDMLRNALVKYQVTYLLVDQYLLNNVSTKPINHDRIYRFLNRAYFLKKELDLGKIKIYKNNFDQAWLSKIETDKVVSAYPNSTFIKNDLIFKDYGNYKADSHNPDFIFPLPSFFSQKLQSDLNFKVEEQKDKFIISPKKEVKIKGDCVLSIPNIFLTEGLIPVEVNIKNGSIVLRSIPPKFYINNQLVEVPQEELTIPLRRVANPQKLVLTDVDYEFTPGSKTVIRNKYLNTIKAVSGQEEELVTLDTRKFAPENEAYLYKIQNIDSFYVEIPKIQSAYSDDNLLDNKDRKISVPSLDVVALLKKGTTVKIDDKRPDKSVSLRIKKESADLSIWKEDLPHNASYIVVNKAKYISGLPTTFYVDNPYEKRAELETRLSKTSAVNISIIPKTQNYYMGYGIHFIVKSLGNETAEAIVEKSAIYPFPEETLTNVFLTNKSLEIKADHIATPIKFDKKNYVHYETSSKFSKGDLLILSQSYHPGWIAYAGGKMFKHVVVNNWANGWELPQNNQLQKVKIIFWPQYLEYAGFFIMLATFLIVIIKYAKSPSDQKS